MKKSFRVPSSEFGVLRWRERGFLRQSSHSPLGPGVPPQSHLRCSNPLRTAVNDDDISVLAGFSCVCKVAVMFSGYSEFRDSGFGRALQRLLLLAAFLHSPLRPGVPPQAHLRWSNPHRAEIDGPKAIDPVCWRTLKFISLKLDVHPRFDCHRGQSYFTLVRN